jgi:hypothetical protein
MAVQTADKMANEESHETVPREDALIGPPEPWESWETTLVVGSLVLGIVGLAVLGWLVDRFILP